MSQGKRNLQILMDCSATMGMSAPCRARVGDGRVRLG